MLCVRCSYVICSGLLQKWEMVFFSQNLRATLLCKWFLGVTVGSQCGVGSGSDVIRQSVFSDWGVVGVQAARPCTAASCLHTARYDVVWWLWRCAAHSSSISTARKRTATENRRKGRNQRGLGHVWLYAALHTSGSSESYWQSCQRLGTFSLLTGHCGACKKTSSSAEEQSSNRND